MKVPPRRAISANATPGCKCRIYALGFLLNAFVFFSQPHYNHGQVSRFLFFALGKGC